MHGFLVAGNASWRGCAGIAGRRLCLQAAGLLRCAQVEEAGCVPASCCPTPICVSVHLPGWLCNFNGLACPRQMQTTRDASDLGLGLSCLIVCMCVSFVKAPALQTNSSLPTSVPQPKIMLCSTHWSREEGGKQAKGLARSGGEGRSSRENRNQTDRQNWLDRIEGCREREREYTRIKGYIQVQKCLGKSV